MHILYFNPELSMYVLQGAAPVPVVLAGLDDFEIDGELADDLEVALSELADDHSIVYSWRGFDYIATRHGVVVTFAQVVKFADYSHSREYLAEALAMVSEYERVAQ